MARLRSFRGRHYDGTLVILDIAKTAASGDTYYSGVLLQEEADPEFEWIHEKDPRMTEGRESHMYVSPFLKPFGGRVGLGTQLRDILENDALPQQSSSKTS
ncbi:hypothetical protein [Alkalicoccus urumqiensis]|uniref:Uncharacterized protein n=1 Tax=Alkalicoccus urumqiensis TaxID=1548213 RepID=A0A2P6ML95_ALKUR|nr:hypothetical protein [Alkalicoccus urumqiensis]PRO67034.1 hypothetical protein C6I21_00260 [Alkalicoccus urumqiensis]